MYTGTDGKVRTVKEMSKGAEYRRPIQKIVVIYPAEGYEEDYTKRIICDITFVVTIYFQGFILKNIISKLNWFRIWSIRV